MALPGKHTRDLYDKLKRKAAGILAQLRTGMARLNGYLNRIGAAESDLCACGHARKTVGHFLLRCTRWTALRKDMLQCSDTRRGSLSFYLGGKAPTDSKQWSPDMKAVRATIKYAVVTRRPEPNEEERLDILSRETRRDWIDHINRSTGTRPRTPSSLNQQVSL